MDRYNTRIRSLCMLVHRLTTSASLEHSNGHQYFSRNSTHPKAHNITHTHICINTFAKTNSLGEYTPQPFMFDAVCVYLQAWMDGNTKSQVGSFSEGEEAQRWKAPKKLTWMIFSFFSMPSTRDVNTPCAYVCASVYVCVCVCLCVCVTLA